MITSWIDRSTVMPEIPLREDGLLELHEASYYDQWPHQSLMLWCHHHARYGLPTAELVMWLREKIAGRTVIEIGSGCGDLALHLGVCHPTDVDLSVGPRAGGEATLMAATDNRMQERQDVLLYYRLMRQPVIRYGAFVEEVDALQAVERYQPEVVVASWVTQWVDADKPVPPEGGNMYGVKEDEIVKRCEYILIGNVNVHGRKPIMALEHEEYALPFLRSRGHDPALNRVWIWRPRT